MSAIRAAASFFALLVIATAIPLVVLSAEFDGESADCKKGNYTCKHGSVPSPGQKGPCMYAAVCTSKPSGKTVKGICTKENFCVGKTFVDQNGKEQPIVQPDSKTKTDEKTGAAPGGGTQAPTPQKTLEQLKNERSTLQQQRDQIQQTQGGYEDCSSGVCLVKPVNRYGYDAATESLRQTEAQIQSVEDQIAALGKESAALSVDSPEKPKSILDQVAEWWYGPNDTTSLQPKDRPDASPTVGSKDSGAAPTNNTFGGDNRSWFEKDLDAGIHNTKGVYQNADGTVTYIGDENRPDNSQIRPGDEWIKDDGSRYVYEKNASPSPEDVVAGARHVPFGERIGAYDTVRLKGTYGDGAISGIATYYDTVGRGAHGTPRDPLQPYDVATPFLGPNQIANMHVLDKSGNILATYEVRNHDTGYLTSGIRSDPNAGAAIVDVWGRDMRAQITADTGIPFTSRGYLNVVLEPISSNQASASHVGGEWVFAGAPERVVGAAADPAPIIASGPPADSSPAVAAAPEVVATPQRAGFFSGWQDTIANTWNTVSGAYEAVGTVVRDGIEAIPGLPIRGAELAVNAGNIVGNTVGNWWSENISPVFSGSNTVGAPSLSDTGDISGGQPPVVSNQDSSISFDDRFSAVRGDLENPSVDATPPTSRIVRGPEDDLLTDSPRVYKTPSGSTVSIGYRPDDTQVQEGDYHRSLDGKNWQYNEGRWEQVASVPPNPSQTQPDEKAIEQYKYASLLENMSRGQYEFGERINLYDPKNEILLEQRRVELNELEARYPCLASGTCDTGKTYTRNPEYREQPLRLSQDYFGKDDQMRIYDTPPGSKEPLVAANPGAEPVRAGFFSSPPSEVNTAVPAEQRIAELRGELSALRDQQDMTEGIADQRRNVAQIRALEAEIARLEASGDTRTWWQRIAPTTLGGLYPAPETPPSASIVGTTPTWEMETKDIQAEMTRIEANYDPDSGAYKGSLAEAEKAAVRYNELQQQYNSNVLATVENPPLPKSRSDAELNDAAFQAAVDRTRGPALPSITPKEFVESPESAASPAPKRWYERVWDAIKGPPIEEQIANYDRGKEWRGVTPEAIEAAKNQPSLYERFVNPPGIKAPPVETPAETLTPIPAPPSFTCSGSSVARCFTESGYDPSYTFRREVARQLGIEGYRGTAAQNMQMLDLLRNDSSVLGGLTPAQAQDPTSMYQPAAVNYPSGSSIVQFLNAGNLDSSFANRQTLYNTYVGSAGLGSYRGTVQQNTLLLNCLRSGICRR